MWWEEEVEGGQGGGRWWEGGGWAGVGERVGERIPFPQPHSSLATYIRNKMSFVTKCFCSGVTVKTNLHVYQSCFQAPPFHLV